jgi:sulfide:quinone oxidoreductase
MSTEALADQVSFAGQISADDVPSLAARGIRAIICNRPDGEQAGQPTFVSIAAAAKAAGLEARHIPVVPGRMTEADVVAMRAALAELPKPVLAYCRSGTRSANLFGLATSRG